VPDYPEALQHVVMKALAKKAEDRYQTARELQQDLGAFTREAKLQIGTITLAQYAEKVFAEKINAWKQAEAAGKSLAERVAEGHGDGGYVGETRRRQTDERVFETVSRQRRTKRLLQLVALVALLGAGAGVVWKAATTKPPPLPPPPPPVVVVQPAPTPPPAVTPPTPPPVAPPPVAPPKRPTEPRGEARVTIAADPWCEVLIDGRPLGQTPIVDAKVTSGAHTLTFLNSGANLHQQVKIKLAPGQAFKKKFTFPH
jgi:hypothetical protein